MKFGSDIDREFYYFPAGCPRLNKRIAQLEEYQSRFTDPTPAPLQWLRTICHEAEPYYLLPINLIDQVEQLVPHLKTEYGWQFERELTEFTSTDREVVGYWKKLPIRSGLFREFTVPESIDPQFAEILSEQHDISCAYAGWLLSNPHFMTEHDKLTWNYQRPPRPLLNSEIWRACYVDYKFEAGYPNFLRRWRLEELAAPGMPIPQVITSASNDHHPHVMKHSQGSLTIPDTMPIPKQVELGQWRKYFGSNNSEPHLREWFELIDPQNPNRRPLEKFSRWFRIRIYWQALLRHSELLRGKYGKLKVALAEFYGNSFETIKSDIADMAI